MEADCYRQSLASNTSISAIIFETEYFRVTAQCRSLNLGGRILTLIWVKDISYI